MDIEQAWLYFKDHYDKSLIYIFPSTQPNNQNGEDHSGLMERQSRQVRRNTGHGKDTKTLEDQDRRNMTDTAEKGTRHSY